MINRDVAVTFTGRNRTGPAVKSVQTGIQSINKEMSGLATRAVSVQRTFAALTLGFAGGNFVSTLGELQTSMARIRGLSQNYASDQQFLGKVTKSLNLDIQESADGFSKLLALQAQGLIGSDQTRDLFVGYQEAAIKFGASSSDIQLSMKGLRQALTAGVIRAQEFDQITDSMSAVLPAVAKQMGITTKELLKFRTSASLSSKEFVDALIPALLEFEGSAESMAGNIVPQLKRLSNSYKEAIQEFETPIGNGVQTFVDAGIKSIDAFVDNADKIKEVGIAIGAVYGARAAGSVLNFVGVQGRAIQSSFAHTQALRAEAGAQLQNEAAALSRARAEQAYTTQKLAQTQAALAANRAGLARNAVLGELAQRQARAVTATSAAVIAQDRYNSALGRVATVQRATALSTAAMARANSALQGSLALVGGPAGVATIAAVGVGYLVAQETKGFRIAGQLREATEGLNAALSETGRISEENADALIDSARKELTALVAKTTALEASGSGAAAAFGFLGQAFDSVAVALYKSQIEDLRAELDAFESSNKIQRLAETWANEFADAGDSVRKFIGELRVLDSQADSTPLIEKILGKKTENDSKIAALRAELSKVNDVVAPEQRKFVTNALKEEIDKLTGAAKSQDAYGKKVKASDRAIRSLSDSLKTERELIEQRFTNAEQTIKLNIELNDLDESAFEGLLAKAQSRMNEELFNLNQSQTDDLRSALEERRRVRDQEIADMQAYRSRITDAQTVIDPSAGITAAFRDEILALNQERGKSIKSDEDYYILAKAAKLQFVDDMAALDAQRISGEKKAFKELSQIQKANLITSTLSSVLKAFEKDVGQRIQLNSSMTAAEREAAQKQNAINKKKFEDNKKYQLGQAAVNIASGILRAYADYTWPIATGIAAAISLVGHKQIQNIRSGTFGGSGGSVSTGGGGFQTNPNDEARTDAQNNGQQINNVVIIGGEGMTDAQRRRMVVQALDKANENDEVNLPGFEVNQVVAQI